jgi:perosamine synthetase
VQLARLPEMQDERDRLAQRYMSGLSHIRGIRTQALPQHPLDRHSWCMFAVRVMPEFGITRDALIDELKNLNIGTSVHYIPTHHFSGYRRFASDKLRATDEIARQILSFPLFPGMSERDVDDVLEAVESCAKQPGVSLAS